MSSRSLIVFLAALGLASFSPAVQAQNAQVAMDTSTTGLHGRISKGVYISPTGMFRIQVPVIYELGGSTTDSDNGVVTFQDSVSTHISVGCFAMDATQRWTDETQGRKDYLTNFLATIVRDDFARHFPGAKLEGTRYRPNVMDGALFGYVTLPNGTMFNDRAIMSDSLPPLVAKRGNLLFVKDEHVYVISVELAEKVLERTTWDKTPEQEDDLLDDRLHDVLDKMTFTKVPHPGGHHHGFDDGVETLSMTAKAFVITLIVGALAGWIAGFITKRRGFGPAGNVVVGIAGALIARFAFGLLGIYAAGFLGQLIFAILGALIFVYLLGLIKR